MDDENRETAAEDIRSGVDEMGPLSGFGTHSNEIVTLTTVNQIKEV